MSNIEREIGELTANVKTLTTTVSRVESSIGKLHGKIDTQASARDAVCRDHAERLTTLETQRHAQSSMTVVIAKWAAVLTVTAASLGALLRAL